jgi:hypothetical protein
MTYQQSDCSALQHKKIPKIERMKIDPFALLHRGRVAGAHGIFLLFAGM